VIDAGVSPERLLGEYFRKLSLEDMQTMLKAVVDSGTGRGAALPIPTYGKTGTTQDNRDALFIGYAGEGEDEVVAGVWLGNDDNSPNPGLSGSGIPARVWRDFMTHALDIQAPPPPPPDGNEVIDNAAEGEGIIDRIGALLGNGTVEVKVDTAPDTPPPPAEKGRREDLIPPPPRPVADDRRPLAADPPRRPAPRPTP